MSFDQRVCSHWPVSLKVRFNCTWCGYVTMYWTQVFLSVHLQLEQHQIFHHQATSKSHLYFTYSGTVYTMVELSVYNSPHQVNVLQSWLFHELIIFTLIHNTVLHNRTNLTRQYVHVDIYITHLKSTPTQFSQEWARRKVVVKHSIKSNLKNTICPKNCAFLISNIFVTQIDIVKLNIPFYIM